MIETEELLALKRKAIQARRELHLHAFQVSVAEDEFLNKPLPEHAEFLAQLEVEADLLTRLSEHAQAAYAALALAGLLKES